MASSRILALLVVSCVLLPLAGGRAVAAAAPTAAIRLQPVHAHISTHAKARLVYHASDLPADSVIVLQLLTGGRWLDVRHSDATSGDSSGTFALPAFGALGRYSLRAEVIRAGATLVRTGRRLIFVYGTVSLNSLCHGVLVYGDCTHGRQHVKGRQAFRFVLETFINEPDDPWVAQLSSRRTSCRSITLHYISDGPDTTRTYVELRQKGYRRQRHTSSSQHVSRFTARLTGNRWGMSVDQDASQIFMYFNGSASCYTADGFLPPKP